MVPAPRIESPSFRSPGFWSVTAWRSSATTSGELAARAGTGIGFVRRAGRRCHRRLRVLEDTQRHRQQPNWAARSQPGRMDHAARRRSCQRPRLSDQHLWRWHPRRRDHNRSGPERNDGSWHEAADCRRHRRTHEAAERIRANRPGLGSVFGSPETTGRSPGRNTT